MNQKYILHICESSVFIIKAIKSFERIYPNQNRFLIDYDRQLHAEIDFSEFDDVVILAQHDSLNYKAELDKVFEDCFLIIFHNLSGLIKVKIAQKFQGKVSLHGICWGFEVYASSRLDKFLYQRKTRQLLNGMNGGKDEIRLKTKIKRELKYLLSDKLNENKFGDMFKMLDSYSTIIESEVLFMKKKFGYIKTNFPFNYSGGYQINEITTQRVGRSLQIGNSATPANNHADIIPYLIDVVDGLDKIVVPLSYGDTMYADKIECLFTNTFGSKIETLREFVPMEDYDKIMSSCSFVVMNHMRQQAMGNIYMSMYQGAKVFLNKKSMGFKELINLGYKVYKLEELKHEIKTLETASNIDLNRFLIENDRGPNAIEKNIRRIVESYREEKYV